MRLAIQVFESPTGAQIADWTHRAVNTTITTGAHGFEALRATIPMTQAEAFQWYDRHGLPHVEVTGADASTVYEGRIEDIAIVPAGLQVVALGYWRALTDRPFTGLWSDTRSSSWRPLVEAEKSDAHPKRFSFDTQDRLYITPRKNEQFSTTIIGYLALPQVSGTARNYRSLSFTYEFFAPSPWRFKASRRTSTYGLTADLENILGNGAIQTNTVTHSFAATTALTFSLYYDGAATVYTGETDANVYVKITNVRVTSSTASTVLASEIVSQMAALANTLNASQLSSSTALITTTTQDLQIEVYHDELMSDICTRLTRLATTTGTVYEVGVWEDRRLHFRPRGSASRTWYVDTTSLEVERSLDSLYNSVYAVYQAAGGSAVRTTAISDAASIARYGITRRRSLQSRTTSSTQADNEAAALLADRKDPMPRAGITVRRVYDATGTLVPLWNVRSGDTLVVRNLSPVLSTSVDRIRTMRLAATSYNVDEDTLDVTPESPLPTLDALLARQDPTVQPPPPPVDRPQPGPPPNWGNDPW